MSTSSKLKQQFVRPAVVGIVSGAIASMTGVDYDAQVFGYEIPKWAFYGALGFGSSLVTESLHQWILPMLPQSQQAITAENALLSPAIHAGVNLTALSVFYPQAIALDGWMLPVGVGIGAEVIGDYSFNSFIKDMPWMR